MTARSEVENYTIESARSAIAAGRTTASALAADYFARIRKEDPRSGRF